MTYQEEIDNEEWWREVHRKQQPNRLEDKMISDERLKEYAEYPQVWGQMAQELLVARQTIADKDKVIERLVEDGERLALIVNECHDYHIPQKYYSMRSGEYWGYNRAAALEQHHTLMKEMEVKE